MSNYKKYFTATVKHHFPTGAENIIADTERHFNNISPDIQFARTSSNPIDRRLDFCGYFLALIITLDERGESFDNIRKICLEIVTEYVRPKNKMQQLLKRLPPKLFNSWLAGIFIKSFHKRTSTNSNPDGFIANIITDKEETFGLGYGIDILECGICKLFKKHHCEKYAAILCEVDEMTSAMAGLQLVRQGTIANGAKKCDFRFKKNTAKYN